MRPRVPAPARAVRLANEALPRCTRRQLLGALAGSVAFSLAGPLRADSGPIRLGWRARPGDASREEGVRMAAAEAAQLARLLGRDFALVENRDADEARVEVTAQPPPAGEDRVWISVAPDVANGPNVFCVPSSPERRRAALARFASEDDPGALRAVDWHGGLDRYGAAQLNQRYSRRAGRPMDEAAWAGWMGVKIALEAVLQGGSGSEGVVAALRRLAFDGHKGVPLVFGEDRALRHPIYVLRGNEPLGEVAP